MMLDRNQCGIGNWQGFRTKARIAANRASSILGVTCLAMTMNLTGTLAVHAETSVTGFREFVFGMTLQDAMAVEPLTKRTTEDNGTWYETAAVTVVGQEFRQQLLMDDDRLVQLNLWRDFPASDIRCTSVFEDVYGALQARYGPAIADPDRSEVGDTYAFTKAVFTMRDTSQIKLSAVHITDCLVNIAMMPAKAGGGF